MAHKGARNDLTAEYVRSLLDYDPESGVLTWKAALYRRTDIVGKQAGWRGSDGRIRLSVNHHQYLAHRVIWLMVTGAWPPEEVDHRDRDPSNNRWPNLRLASSSQNQANHGLQSNNTSGFRGVSFNKRTGLYVAYVFYNNKSQYLGYFHSAEAAYAARRVRAKELHGEFDGEAHVKA